MEKGEVLVKVDGVSKKFCRNLKRSLWYGLTDISRSLVGAEGNITIRKDEFWAVKNISFEVRRGECLGLIGHNGAGKSTLLKMLNGLIRPDGGRIEMRGRTGALIELGAGFNPLLSGRQNVYTNGAVLGFSKQEIDQKFDEIVHFAELEEFIDMPVQNYSSGMKVRLGFAVASQMEPDILIIDEVLAVGDLGFVLKCYNVIDKLLENTCVIFVSHSMPTVSRICSGILLMENGMPIFNGPDVSKGIDIYYSKFARCFKQFRRYINEAELIEINVKSEQNTEVPIISHGGDLIITFKVKLLRKIKNASVGFTIYDKEQRPIGILLNPQKIPDEFIYDLDDEFVEINASLKSSRINLSKGVYSLTFFVSESLQSKPILRLHSVIYFQVVSERDVWPPIEFECSWIK